MTPEFNRWWDADELTQTNPYREESPAWWAWEGWQAAQRSRPETTEKDMGIVEKLREYKPIDETSRLIVDAATEIERLQQGGEILRDELQKARHDLMVRAICEDASEEIERSRQSEALIKGECLLLADVLRDAFEVIKTVEGDEQYESDKLTGLCLSIAHALSMYDDERIKVSNQPDLLAEFVQSEIDSAVLVITPDCKKCANRGQIDGLSQETHCEHCKHQESWREDHYAPNATELTGAEGVRVE